MKKYVYDPLPTKRIRLMRLAAGARNDSIQCELFEAAYDNSFHIPTQVSLKRKGLELSEPEWKRQRPQVGEPERAREEGRMEDLKTKLNEATGAKNKAAMEEIKTEIKILEKEILRQELVRVEEIEIEYEALSWCWGRNVSDYGISVTKGGESYKMAVRRDLVLALSYLRRKEKPRILWIDAICIDQDNSVERNQQVQMMSRIYTRAENVCIWLGEQDNDSEIAFKFIQDEITHLKDFDSISSNKDYNNKWQALMKLMQREWFSRRWVVQELSLANKAEIWCGRDWMPWKEFAVAVELFVEVESATHRLSEVVQKDVQFKHVPGWFEYVSHLGASLLVQATGKVFRSYGTPMDKNETNDKETDREMTDEQKAKKEKNDREKAKKDKHEHRENSLDNIQTIDPLDRRSLLSLEFLVTTMYVFKASECRDSVYSMLAIARDAAPFAKDAAPVVEDANAAPSSQVVEEGAEPAISTDDVSFQLSLFEGFLAEKPFLVDYARPYSDVCRDFMEFCIQRKSLRDPVQALDILCRPWALEPQTGSSARLKTNKQSTAGQDKKQKRLTRARTKPWTLKHCDVEVSPKYPPEWVKKPSSEEHSDERTMDKYWEDMKERKEWKAVDNDSKLEIPWKIPEGGEKVKELCKDAWKRKQIKKKGLDTSLEENKDMEPREDIDLPSWVPRAQNAPFEIYRQPGSEYKKTGRANADPLVGWPQDGHRNYSAAQTEAVKMDCLKFRRRPNMRHYSLYVAGFVVGTLAEVKDASQGGSIPNSWLELSGWEPPYDKDPPDEFWRTIVADRGVGNRNPPYYYARACRESVDKGGRESGSVNTTALINNERNSIIAEFCRRVHAVIWGRSLFKMLKTGEDQLAEGKPPKGKLGLGKNVQKDDLVCILHGCTVPVILSPRRKKPGEREDEKFEDKYEAFKSCFQRMEKICARKERYKDRIEIQRKLEERNEQRGQHEQQEEEGGDLEKTKWERDVKEALETVRRILEADQKAREDQQESDRNRKQMLKQPVEEGAEEIIKEPRFNQDEDFFYVFKGESYVHGCMDGEAVRERFYGDEQEKIFELR
jgi:hypothetical protein